MAYAQHARMPLTMSNYMNPFLCPNINQVMVGGFICTEIKFIPHTTNPNMDNCFFMLMTFLWIQSKAKFQWQGQTIACKAFGDVAQRIHRHYKKQDPVIILDAKFKMSKRNKGHDEMVIYIKKIQKYHLGRDDDYDISNNTEVVIEELPDNAFLLI